MSKLILSIFLLLSYSVHAEQGDSEEIPKAPTQLSASLLNYEGDLFLGVQYRNHPHWHTYWKNPGDSGLPTTVKFYLDEVEVTLEAMEWPVPKRYVEKGDILAYGYEGDYTLFYKLSTSNIEDFQNKQFKIESKWLVCKHICIPGQGSIEGQFNGNEFQSTSELTFVFSQQELTEQFNNLPAVTSFPDNLDLALTRSIDGEGLTLYYNMPKVNMALLKTDMSLLTPFPLSPFDYRREALYKDKKSNLYGKISIDWDGIYQEPVVELPASGRFDKPYELKFLYANPSNGKIEVISKSFSSFSLDGANSLESFFEYVTEIKYGSSVNTNQQDSSSQQPTNNSFLIILLMAFIGGLILNAMPCVLPVISLKLFGIIKHRNESKRKIFLHNMYYTLGVLITFILFAGTIVALKASGQSVGWGFQLQSAPFVAIMILVIFIMGLNLFSLFEFSTPGGRKLGDVDLKDSFLGDFFGGMMATVLSTPCSAPFLGVALTYAFTTTTSNIFIIFIVIGLGLSSPFILTGIFPKLISFLPKPGAWMDHFKKFMGLTLLLTTIWLLDLYSALVDTGLSVIKINTVLVLTFFAFYLRKNISKKIIWNIIFFGIPLFLFIGLIIEKPSLTASTGGSALLNEKVQLGLPWEKWSREKMQEYKNSGDLVFIDFTAKWCFTCKVNEKLVIHTQAFKDLIESKNIKLLLGDWTKRDALIEGFLKEHRLVGVPAYFIQKQDGTLIKLGETISIGKIEDNL